MLKIIFFFIFHRYNMAFGRTGLVFKNVFRASSRYISGQNDEQHSIKRLDTQSFIGHNGNHNYVCVQRIISDCFDCFRKIYQRFMDTKIINLFGFAVHTIVFSLPILLRYHYFPIQMRIFFFLNLFILSISKQTKRPKIKYHIFNISVIYYFIIIKNVIRI